MSSCFTKSYDSLSQSAFLFRAFFLQEYFLFLSSYYVATTVDDPGVRHVYSVTDMEVPDLEFRRQIRCLSCDMGPGCLYNDAVFSPNGRHMILNCLGPGLPRSELRVVSDNSVAEILNTNPKLEEWLDVRAMPRTRQLSIPLVSGGAIRFQLLLPLGLVESDTSKYPLVIEL